MSGFIIKNKSVLIVLPEKGFNEIEFNTCKSVFEKSGFKTFIASKSGGFCAGERSAKIKSDIPFFNLHASNFNAVVFIGGIGTSEYFDSEKLHSLVKEFLKQKKTIGAICAAPVILARSGILENKKAAAFPESIKEMRRAGVDYIDESVVQDGNIITARDQNSADQFAGIIISNINKMLN